MASTHNFLSPYRSPATPEAMLELAREHMAQLKARIGALETLAQTDEVARSVLDAAMAVVRPVESLTRCAIFLMAAKIMPGLPPQEPLAPPITSREFIPPPVLPSPESPPPQDGPAAEAQPAAPSRSAGAPACNRTFQVSATDAVTYYMSVSNHDPDARRKVEAFNARFKRGAARGAAAANDAGDTHAHDRDNAAPHTPLALDESHTAPSSHHAAPLAARIGAVMDALANPEPHAQRLAVKLARYVAGANGEFWIPNCRLWRPREAYRRTPPPEPLRELYAAINKASDLCRDTVYYNWPPRPPPGDDQPPPSSRTSGPA